jgi:hypothetical protein
MYTQIHMFHTHTLKNIHTYIPTYAYINTYIYTHMDCPLVNQYMETRAVHRNTLM